jgi:RNA polymerase sigma-70 factor (ECF subfamily)
MQDARGQAEPSDAELMRRTVLGDRDAFAGIYRRHHGTIFRFARLMTGCTTAAEDVVQEVFLALMRNAARYEPAQSTLSTYLYGIARHQTRRRLVRDRRFVAFDEGTAEPVMAADTDVELARRSDVERLRQAVLTLPSRYREAVVLCDLQDMSYGDAAATLACPIGTVRSRLHRGRQLLAEKLGRASATASSGIITAAARVRCAT